VIGEEQSGYILLRPAWRENLSWLSLIAMIVSAAIFLRHYALVFARWLSRRG
jgi:hypothetical protein